MVSGAMVSKNFDDVLSDRQSDIQNHVPWLKKKKRGYRVSFTREHSKIHLYGRVGFN